MILFLIYIVYIIWYWWSLNLSIVFYWALFFLFYIAICIFYHKKSIRINKNNSIKKFEIINTIRSLIIYFFIILWIFYLYSIWYIVFDFSVSWYIIVFETILFILYDDAFFYLFHRIMHIPIIYKYSHIVHHRSVYSNIMSAYNFGFLEAFVYAFSITPIFIFHLNIYSFLVAIFINDFANVLWHSWFEMFYKNKRLDPLWFFQLTSYHDLHHTKNRSNYALYFSYLDKIFKTYDKRNQKSW